MGPLLLFFSSLLFGWLCSLMKTFRLILLFCSQLTKERSGWGNIYIFVGLFTLSLKLNKFGVFHEICEVFLYAILPDFVRWIQYIQTEIVVCWIVMLHVECLQILCQGVQTKSAVTHTKGDFEHLFLYQFVNRFFQHNAVHAVWICGI